MWTAGFPEPRTFSRRVGADPACPARRLRRRARQPDARPTGSSTSSAPGCPLVATIHHPITFDRRVDLAAATSWRRRLTLRRWYGFLRMQGRVARRLGRVLVPVGELGARRRHRLRGRPVADPR